MLVAMIAMYFQAGTTDIPTLLTYPFAPRPMRVLGLHAWSAGCRR